MKAGRPFPIDGLGKRHEGQKKKRNRRPAKQSVSCFLSLIEFQPQCTTSGRVC